MSDGFIDLKQTSLNMLEWMKSKKFDVDDSDLRLVVSPNKDEGRCVISNKTFKADELIIRVPFDFLIHYKHSIRDENLLEFFNWTLSTNSSYKLTRLDALYMLLILTRFDENSELYTFIKTMPIRYDTPEYFDNDLIECLPSSYLKNEIKLRINKLNDKYINISHLLNKFSLVNSNISIEALRHNFTLEIFKWSFCSVNSRCFHIKEKEICTSDEIDLLNKLFGPIDKTKMENSEEENLELEDEKRNSLCCLIPFLDFLNHSNTSNAFAFYDNEAKSFMLKSQLVYPDDDTEQDIANKTISENKQVYITYGYHDNKTLLIEYGFIIENNVHDKLLFKKSDFEKYLKTEASDELWPIVYRQKLLDDLSINIATGPSWCLLKLIDLIIEFNKANVGAYDNYDFKNVTETKEIFIDLLKKYEQDLNESIGQLNSLTFSLNDYSCYHKSLLLKLLNLHLLIIETNVNLANDNEKWIQLF